MRPKSTCNLGPTIQEEKTPELQGLVNFRLGPTIRAKGGDVAAKGLCGPRTPGIQSRIFGLKSTALIFYFESTAFGSEQAPLGIWQAVELRF